MTRYLAAITLVVPDYDAAIAFYVDGLGFDLVVDTDLGGGRRWVLVAPPGAQTRLLLAEAATPEQTARIGDQTGGRVGFFLATDDFAGDHDAMLARGVRFLEEPRGEAYGTVAVFEDPWGNRWDLIQPTPRARERMTGLPGIRADKRIGRPVVRPSTSSG